MSEASAMDLPVGSACAMHRERDARFVCTRCGSYGCEGCTFSALPGKQTCRACGALGLGEPIPWERRKELGLWRAFWQTTRLASRQPTAFFRTPPVEDGPLGPLLYGVAAYTVGQVLAMTIVMGGFAVFFGVIALTGAASGAGNAEELGVMTGTFLGMAVILVPLTLLQAPAYAVFGLVVGGGLSHLTLAAGKRTGAGFEQTLRAVSYANAPYFWYFIPCVGPLLAWVWMLVVERIALREAHQTTGGWALLAVLGYRLLIFGLVVGVYVGFIVLAIALAETR